MRKILSRIACAVLCMALPLAALCPGAANAASFPTVSARSAIVTSCGVPLYEKNAQLRLPMASTTKLMTALIALESCAEDEIVDIKSEYCGVEGSSMYLTPGEKRSVGELVSGLLLVSGNDAAQALAGHIAGDSAHFAALMNARARELGMNDTHYTNPHGLTDTGHYTTARDLALLMDTCMKNEAFARYSAMSECTVDGKLLINHNRLLQTCPGCIGGKTGYTEAAGRCLVSCCERNGARLVCVTLDAPDDWRDHCALYDWAYAEFAARSVTENMRFSVPIISGGARRAYLVPEEELTLLLPREKELVLQAELPWFKFAPVRAKRRDGKVIVTVDGKTIAEYYLVYENDIPLKER